MLEEEIYGENSPIWEADFTVPASEGTQLGHQTGEAGLVNDMHSLWCAVVAKSYVSLGTLMATMYIKQGAIKHLK